MRIHLITCVKDKAEKSCPAIEMYKGDLFARLVDIAQKEADQFYILSGKYGLLLPETIISPYDVHLGRMPQTYRMSWYQKVLSDLSKVCDLQSDHFTLFCAEPYYKGLIPFMKSFEIPMIIH